MAAVINTGNPPQTWSSCSVSTVREAFSRSRNNLARCLHNEPDTPIGDPACGNGIREGTEVCDCGTPQVSLGTTASVTSLCIDVCTVYSMQCIHVHICILMRDERRKEERSKQDQTNNKAKQHSTPKAVAFLKKNELPQVGLEPTTLYTLDRALYMYH